MAPAGRLGELVEDTYERVRLHYGSRDVKWRILVEQDDRRRPIVVVEVESGDRRARWTVFDEMMLNLDREELRRLIDRTLPKLDAHFAEAAA